MADKNYISWDILKGEYSAVYHYVLSLCRDENEAYDITQEAFLKAMKSSSSFKSQSSLYTWLCAIAKNILSDRQRAQSRLAPLPDDSTPYKDRSIEDIIAEKDLSMHIHRALHSLNEPYKEVFSLRVFGLLPFSDIAKLFDKTESWARVTYHRAKKQITDILRKDGNI